MPALRSPAWSPARRSTCRPSRLGQHLAHLQQPAVFPQPAGVARPATAQPAKPSLALPLVLMVAPFVLVAVLFGALLFLDFNFSVNRLALGLATLAGGACFVV